MKLLTVALILITSFVFSQSAPSCPTNSILAHNGNSINNHSLPNGPLNTILSNIPAGSGGLAVGPAFGFPAPNPTWWTTIGGNYWYYNNGGTWSNSGHSTGNGAAVNIGGGSTRLYNLVGATGQIYVYNGLGNGTLLTTLVPAFNGGGPYDIVCDMADNFYILKSATPGQGIYCYNPQGVLTCSWSVTGMISQTAGGGFSILTTTNPAVHKMYYNSNGTDYIGNMIPGNTTIASTVQALPGGSDYASCALPIPTGTIVAPLGGTLTCSLPQIPLVAQVLGNASLNWLGGYGTPTTTPITPTCGGITWSGPGIVSGQGTSTIQVNQPGVYSFTLNGCNSCPGYSITASFTVVGQAAVINPVISLSNTLTCFTPSAQLVTTPIPPGFTYTWTGPGITSTNTNTANINQPGTYTVAVSSNTSACAGTATILVPSNTVAPTLTITPSFTNICFGQSATINVSGANTYTWSNAQNGTSITISPASTTQYTVVGTNSVNGCTSTAVANVSVTPLPIPLPVNNGPICIGGNLVLNCSGGVTYIWSGPNSFTSSTQSNTITNVSVLNAGIYTVVATSGVCSASATTNVIVNVLPTPNIITNSPICANQLLTFNGNGGNTYSWSGPGFSSNLQNPTIVGAVVGNSGTYTLTVMDANGCINSTTANVIVNPLPIVSASGSSVCSGVNVTLTSSGGVSYSWNGPSGFTSSNQNPVILNSNVNNSGNYVVTVTDVNGCVNSAIANVSVTPPYTINVTNNSPVCQGYTLNFSAPLGYGYTWIGPNGFYSNLSSPYIDNAQPSASGVYSLLVTDANGCTSSTIISAVVNPNPIPSIVSTNDRLCAPACITFTINSTNTISNISWFFLNGGVSSNSVSTQCFNRGGVYSSSATVTDNNGCIGSVTHTIEIYPKPTADFVFSPIKPIEGNEVLFTDASFGSNINQWYWFFNSQNINSTLQNPHYSYMEPGSYPITLIIKSDKGCSDTLTKVIIVGEDYGIYVPNAFTPNDDGFNDTFFAKGYGIVKFEMNIFDRWGEKVFSTNDMRNAWDGTFRGKLCKDDTYVWKINLTNVFGKSHELKGHVTLMK